MVVCEVSTWYQSGAHSTPHLKNSESARRTSKRLHDGRAKERLHVTNLKCACTCGDVKENNPTLLRYKNGWSFNVMLGPLHVIAYTFGLGIKFTHVHLKHCILWNAGNTWHSDMVYLTHRYILVQWLRVPEAGPEANWQRWWVARQWRIQKLKI